MFWLLVVATLGVLLPTFVKVCSVGQNAALGRVPVKLPLVVSQIRIRSIGEHVNVVVFRLIAIGTWPLIGSIPVGLGTAMPAPLKGTVRRTAPGSRGNPVRVVVLRFTAMGPCPLTTSIPVGLATLTPASLKSPVSRTL